MGETDWLMDMRKWLGEVGHQADEIASAAAVSPLKAKKLLVPTRQAGLYSANHGLNAGIYASIVGGMMGLMRSDLRILALAGIVHDVGNVYVSGALLDKPGPLTAPEREQVKLHTRNGADLLELLGAPQEAVRAALEHHERADGSGYPVGLEESAMHPFSRIVSVADCYDALTSVRPWGEAQLHKFAMETMTSMLGRFDRHILELFQEIG